MKIERAEFSGESEIDTGSAKYAFTFKAIYTNNYPNSATVVVSLNNETTNSGFGSGWYRTLMPTDVADEVIYTIKKAILAKFE